MPLIRAQYITLEILPGEHIVGRLAFQATQLLDEERVCFDKEDESCRSDTFLKIVVPGTSSIQRGRFRPFLRGDPRRQLTRPCPERAQGKNVD